MIRLGVIGDPVSHSLSPLLHSSMAKAIGAEVEYRTYTVKAGETAAFLDFAQQEGITGFNATMPHKRALLELVEPSRDALALDAVNTAVWKNGAWQGYNTDGEGLLRALAEAGLPVRGAAITVLGAGGAAGAAICKLAEAGAETVFLHVRRSEQGRPYVDRFPGQIRLGDWSEADLAESLGRSGLLVNGTPLGMAGLPKFPFLKALEALPQGAGVYDMIYNPRETELIRRARNLGFSAHNGLGMLIHQAILALELFLERPLDAAAMSALLRERLEEL